MSLTKDRVFIDSNIFVYLLSNDERKKLVAINLLSKRPVISVQVINENTNAALRKLKIPEHKAIEHAKTLMIECVVKPISKQTIVIAFDILQTYHYSYYDCMIISSALEAKCNVLYSKDLQHKQIVQSTLKIVNPFL